MPQSPKHKLVATPSYTLPLDEGVGTVSVSATYIYTAKQVASCDSPLSLPPSRQVVNFNLNWNNAAGGSIDASDFITNGFNEKYPVLVSNGYRRRARRA